MQARALSADDAPQVVHLSAQLGYICGVDDMRRRLEAITSKQDHWVLCVDRGDGILGFIHFYERPSLEKGFDIAVQSLVVDRRCRRTGVGRLLMEAAEAIAKSTRRASIALSSRIDRSDARAFYEALGYEITATSNVFVKRLI